MSDRLLPPPEVAPTLPPGTTPGQRIAIRLDLLQTGHELLLAGFRRQVGPDGDVRAAYRAWYARQMEEHDRVVAHMLQRMKQRHAAASRPDNA